MELFLLANIKSLLLCYYRTQCFEAVRESHKLTFRSAIKFADTKLSLTQHSEHLNTEQYWGSADRVEVDVDSGVNHLASGKLR